MNAKAHKEPGEGICEWSLKSVGLALPHSLARQGTEKEPEEVIYERSLKNSTFVSFVFIHSYRICFAFFRGLLLPPDVSSEPFKLACVSCRGGRLRVEDGPKGGELRARGRTTVKTKACGQSDRAAVPGGYAAQLRAEIRDRPYPCTFQDAVQTWPPDDACRSWDTQRWARSFCWARGLGSWEGVRKKRGSIEVDARDSCSYAITFCP